MGPDGVILKVLEHLISRSSNLNSLRNPETTLIYCLTSLKSKNWTHSYLLKLKNEYFLSKTQKTGFVSETQE